jgi:hypothetical protein
MAQATWYLERYDKGATEASWSGEFTDFAQVLSFVTLALGSGMHESIRFISPDDVPAAQIKQLLALGAWERA